MSVRAMEEMPAIAPGDDFHALEEKIYRTIELLKEAREAKTAAERTAARLREQLEGHDGQTQALRAEVVALRREREEVRTRVEKMLKQIEALTQEESGG
jgi:chromosome segregation ATPase